MNGIIVIKKEKDFISKKEEQERISLEKAAAQHHKKKIHKAETVEEVLSMLNELIGMDVLKKSVGDLCLSIQNNQKRKEMGLVAENPKVHIVLTGNPGTGKTTLAKVIANTTSAEFTQLNATVAGKKDMEEIVRGAKERLGMYGKKTILFVDEIHRFNKGQQDYLLPFVEDGTIILIGATFIIKGIYMFYICEREYRKCAKDLDNCYDHEMDIKWIMISWLTV